MNMRFWPLLSCLALGLAIAGCSPPADQPQAMAIPLPTDTVAPLPTPTIPPTPTWTPTVIPTSTSTPTIVPTPTRTPIPTAVPPMGLIGWHKISSGGAEFWLPPGYVGGGPEALDFVVDGLERQGPNGQSLASEMRQDPDASEDRIIYVLEPASDDGMPVIMVGMRWDTPVAVSATELATNLAKKMSEETDAVTLDNGLAAGRRAPRVEVISDESAQLWYFVSDKTTVWVLFYISPAETYAEKRPIFEIIAASFALRSTNAEIAPIYVSPNQEERDDWTADNSTPGVRLTLHEINRNENSDPSSVRYDIHASGFTSDRPLVLWIWLLTVDHPTAVGQFILDAEGHLRGQVTNQLYEGLAVHNFYRGEALYVAVMTVDQSARAYAKVIPFPITSTNPDGCALELELVSRAGTIFAATGRGFQPGEGVTTRSTALGETRQSTDKAGADGTFTSELMPAVAGKDSGRASYTAAGEKCQVTLEYDWGLSAVRPAGRSPTDNEMQSGVRTDHTFLPNDHTEQRWTPEREG